MFKALAGVDEEDVVGIVALLLEHQDAGRDTGPKEDICREADDGIEVVAILDEVSADVPSAAPRNSTPCGRTTAMVAPLSRWWTMCWTKAKSALVLGASLPYCAESLVILKDGVGGPVGGEWRVGDDGLETQVGVL